VIESLVLVSLFLYQIGLADENKRIPMGKVLIGKAIE
jgi:hypothetical protein